MKKLVYFALALSALSAESALAKDIQNFRQVAPSVYAGANPFFIGAGDARDDLFPNLANHGVKTIVDLQGTDVTEAPNAWTRAYNEMEEPGEQPGMILKEQQFANRAGISFNNLPINSNNPVSAEEEERINKILEILKNSTPEAPVYVHCQHGADRTGLIVALYRILIQNPTLPADQRITIDQANEEWTKFGHSEKSRAFTGALDKYFCQRVKATGPSEFCGNSGE